MRRLVAFRILLHDLPTTAGAVLGVMAIIFLVGHPIRLSVVVTAMHPPAFPK